MMQSLMQRSYSLPSCTLLVEGISTGSEVLSIVTSFGCRFNHHPEPIIGGLDLLKAMVTVVGAYAQSFASNNPSDHHDAQVQIKSEGEHFHVLSVLLNQSDASNPKQMQVKLNTIQLFDLIESLDRLCCDPTTLPEVNLLTQRAVQRPPSMLGDQAIPAIAGVFSVAIAAAFLYLIPTPKPDPQPSQGLPVPTQTVPKPTPTPTVSPTSETSPKPEAAPNPEISPNPESTSTPTPEN